MAGVLMNGERSAAFTGIGLEPERQRRMGIEVKLRGGDFLPDTSPERGEDQVLIGIDLARALQTVPGDVIVAMIGTSTGFLNAIDLTVAGLYTTGLQELDSSMAQVHLSTAQWLLGTEEVSELLVGLEDGAVTQDISMLLDEYLNQNEELFVINSWENRAPFYRQVRGLYIGIFVFLGTIIGLLVALATSNTFQMSVLERVREFGVLLAMGTDRIQLVRLVVMEALWLSVLGSLVGGLLTVTVSGLINVLEIEMPPPPGAVDPIMLSVLLQPLDFALAMVLMMFLLVLATVPPMMRIFRLRVVEALGYV
jgi:putative ABC transport system permease protein